MKVLGIYDKSGPKYHRILMPIHVMGVECEIKYRLEEKDFEGIDILFFNRMISHISLNQLIDFRAKYGFKMVCDLDDHWKLDPTHLLYEQYKYFGTSELIEAFVKESDAVFVTHERLYQEARQVNSNVYIIPNAIAKTDQFLFNKTPDDKVRLFWAGGITHEKDIEILRGPSKRINSPKVKWVMGGYDKKHKQWQSMASTYTNGGKFDHDLIQSLGVHEYYAAYTKCDIALIPLVDNSFNRYKSNLKILEAANMGCPVVVSAVHPYLDFPEHLVNYVRKQSEWYTHVTNLVNVPAFREQQGKELQAYCDKHYNFIEINKKREDVFTNLTLGVRKVRVPAGSNELQ